MSMGLKETSRKQRPARNFLRLKRVFDTALVLASAPVTLPAAVLTAVLVRQKMGAPILFRQQRIGLDEQSFELLKFRSMLPERDEAGTLLTESERLTTFGRLLRKSSMDELPQLLHVLRGEMSLVGPRPLLLDYLPHYRPAERLRHTVRPGITGAAQVNGRNHLDWEGRLLLDVDYVKNASLVQDLQILWTTFTRVFRTQDTLAESWEHIEDFDDYRSYPSTGTHALRRLEPRDIPTLASWLKDEEPADLGISEITPAGIRHWIQASREQPGSRTLAVYDHQTRSLQGIAGYHTPVEETLPRIFFLAEKGTENQHLADTILGLLLTYLRQQTDLAGAARETTDLEDSTAELYRRHGFRECREDSAAGRKRWEIRW